LGSVLTKRSAELYDELGIQMELNAQGPDRFWLKYNVGSARPMRHVTPAGRVLDVFQQPTVIYDDAAIADRLGGRSAEEAGRVLSYVDEALSGSYMPLTMQSHPLSFTRYSAPFFRAVWAGLRERGVDIVSAEQWADYVIARDASALRSAAEPGGTVRVAVLAVGDSTQAVALQTRAGSVITVDGAPVEPRQRVIGGLDWSVVTVAAAADGARHLIEQRHVKD
jgi:FtsP/CotA-like multicopper oxidase with cupredoxin domain